MTDAPERIWAGHDDRATYWVSDNSYESEVEYIRADLVARKDAALLAAEELAKAVDVQHTAIGLTPICVAALAAFRAAMEADQ